MTLTKLYFFDFMLWEENYFGTGEQSIGDCFWIAYTHFTPSAPN